MIRPCKHRGRDYKDNTEGSDYEEYVVGHVANSIRIRKIKAFAFFLGFRLVFFGRTFIK